ncbi:hypothetical protein DSLASN_27600 [Desulfoluna limicola]|uniref:Uncharacterized protein n=1 Tax=Desulfoluna limicola TaxID=2810562 RepID=A0ABM7PHR7_9BACT|nr:hypothetical protein DSLASN_27600 [Desulfoluna limicola]
MGDTIGGNGVGQCGGDMGLAHHIFEKLGSVFSGKDKIGHGDRFSLPAEDRFRTGTRTRRRRVI